MTRAVRYALLYSALIWLIIATAVPAMLIAIHYRRAHPVFHVNDQPNCFPPGTHGVTCTADSDGCFGMCIDGEREGTRDI